MDEKAPLPSASDPALATPETFSAVPTRRRVLRDASAAAGRSTRQRPDPNALTWPPARSDVLSVFSFIMAGLLVYLRRSDWLIAFTFACGVFAGLSPRALVLALRAGPQGIDADLRLADPLQDELTSPNNEETKQG
jgi:hypothetical protein